MIRFFVRNSVFVNLLMIVILVSGVLIYLSITREMFPEFSLDTVSIQTKYLGASPQEVEKLITIKIEDEITRDLTLDDAVKKLRGKPGTKVTISIIREDVEKLLDFTITRAIIKLKISHPFRFMSRLPMVTRLSTT